MLADGVCVVARSEALKRAPRAIRCPKASTRYRLNGAAARISR